MEPSTVLTDGYIFVGNPSNQATATSSLFVQGSTGNVGIGTTGPTHSFDVGSGSDFYVDIGSAVQVGGSIDFFVDGDGLVYDTTSNRVGIGTTTPGYLLDVDGDFRVGEAGTSNAFFVNAGTGEVGIGTASPSDPLHLFASVPEIRLEDSDGGYAVISGSGGSLSFNADPTNAQPGSRITFEVDGSEKMRLDLNGQLGIGTTSPFGKLTVEQGTETASLWVGNTGSSSPSLMVSGVNGDGRVGIGTDSPGVKLEVAGSSGDGIRISGAGGIALGANAIPNQGISFANNFIIRDSGSLLGFDATSKSNAIVITGSGNVGIGTTSPSAVLEVLGDFRVGEGSNYNALFVDATNGMVGIRTASPSEVLDVEGNIRGQVFLSDSSVSSLPGDDAGVVRMYRADGSGSFPFNVAGNLVLQSRDTGGVGGIALLTGDSSDVRFMIDNSGNVGIGTTSPTRPLHISSGTGSMVRFNITSATGDIVVDFAQAETRRAFFQYEDSGDKFDIINEYGPLVFMTGTGGSEAERMTIDSSGNVGIGTTSPTTLFAVHGSSNGVYVDSTGKVGIGTAAPAQPLSISSQGEAIRISPTATAHRMKIFSGELGNYLQADYDAQEVFEVRYDSSADSSGGGVKFEYGTRISSITDGTYPATLEFSPRGNSGTITSLFLDSSGNVGIGTTSPTTLLTVGSSTPNNIASANYYNSAYVSGDLEVDGTIYGISYRWIHLCW